MHGLCYCLASHNMTEGGWSQIRELCRISYSRVLPAILMPALLTNLLNVCVLLRPRSLASSSSNPARTYLLWLGLSHCAVCGVVLVGVSVSRRVGLPYAWAFYLSHLEEYLYDLFNCSCAYLILALSWDRFCAICRPHRYCGSESSRRTPVKVLAAYTVPTLLYLPKVFSQAPRYSSQRSGWEKAAGTIFDTAGWRTWSVILQFLHRILPSVLLLILNLLILRAVIKLKTNRTVVRRGSDGKHNGREQQIIYLLLGVTLTFLLTNIPAGVMQLIYAFQATFCHTSPALELARIVCNCIEMAGVSCDFVLYFVMNSEYRHDLRNMVWGWVWGCRYYCGCCAEPELHEDTTQQRRLQSIARATIT